MKFEKNKKITHRETQVKTTNEKKNKYEKSEQSFKKIPPPKKSLSTKSLLQKS